MSHNIAGQELKCAHCGGREFAHRHAQVDTRSFSLIDLEIWNPAATVFICRRCHRIEWFFGEIEAAETATPAAASATDCLSCEGKIPADAQRCPNCGWSYLD